MATTEVSDDIKVRLRRTQSVNQAQEIRQKEIKERQSQPDQPCHAPRDSLLSLSTGYTNYKGIFNLCILLLILSNARVALENVMRYGILIDPVQIIKMFLVRPSQSPTILLGLGINIFILVSLFIEICLANKTLKEISARYVIIAHLTALIIIPAGFVYRLDCDPVGASVFLSLVSVTFLKLVSYHMVNYWCREHQKKLETTAKRNRSTSMILDDQQNGSPPKSSLVAYPDNIHLKDLYYFIFAPTLCYELNFPRSGRIRKRFLVKRAIEMFVLLQVIIALIQQWIVPAINNSFKPLQEMNFSHVLERLLKLAVPNHLIWLIFFYWLFHSCLNTFAEILQFADREFYKDWWNSESVNIFWRKWNIPVHRWCVRHLYKPLLIHGFSKFHANLAVFIVSAFFHEYLVSVPLKMFKSWAFLAMMGQVPFAMFVNRYLNNELGNVAVWLSLIIGQPLAILMYYHDYYVIHFR